MSRPESRAIFAVLVERPVLGVEEVCALSGSTPRAAYDVLEKLEELGILKEITRRKRDRLWSAPDVFDVIDGLEGGPAGGSLRMSSLGDANNQ
jgi:hypothetical protein